MQFKKLLSVSALAGVAFANNSTLTTATPSVTKSCSFSDYTATASSQIASIAACATAVGDITIHGDGFGAIDLTGTQEIYGDLTVDNADLATSFNAPDLSLISGNFTIENSTVLASLNLAVLTTVGTFTLNALPALGSTGLTTGLTSAEEVVISDTGLTSLEGISVFELKVFNVNNNKDIESIDSSLQSVTEELSISYNSESVDVVLDQLTTAQNVNLQTINSFSISNITSINGSLSIISSTIDTVDFPSLTTIGNSLTISKNDDLEELEFPLLTSIGGALEISNNDKLASFDGFEKLKTIGGSVVLNGTFDNGTFPDLTKVAGGFTLVSDGELTCTEFTKLNSEGDIKGDKYYCSGASGKTSSSSAKSHAASASTSSSESLSSSTSTSTTKSSDANTTPYSRFMSVVAAICAVGAALF